ncbi:MAG TPA: hypothetical protein VF043_22020 [Ktedonobacteraceae bacterium]
MYCNWCGSQLPADQMLCPKCGLVTPGDTSIPSVPSVKEEGSPQEFVFPSDAFGPIMEFSLPDAAIQTQEPVRISSRQNSSVGTPQAPSGYAQPFPILGDQVGIGPTATGRRRLSRGMTILLVAVAVCVICSGIGLIYYVAIAQPEKFYAQATATAQTRAKAQARASATAFAQSPQGIFEKATHETPLVNQTLANNNAGLWNVLNQSSYGGCSFISGAYHIRVSVYNNWFYCFSIGDYTDFAFQVHMTLLQGSAGGILFHSLGPEVNTYVFALAKDGSYLLTMLQNNNVTSTLASNHSPAIRAGLNQTNVLTVIMRGSNIYLYANKQFLTKVSESTLTEGYCGLFASTDTYTNSGDAAFTNETLWE